ncbi:putative transcriptional regulator [Halovivax ruber XH-70]|uniref:Putative transcriptional regulator n=1 Tax=Halovivax ruber (strain DSM 18193 / JCM 13892 / XH-70) TaxID=797302 RepID=L0IAC3_HALRX|nr:winged helix-turn-helix transcriptional regulator [Halovivax ruber]AGB15684.1 putative transcriptional regulator [Halovivax ruber XH-70]
MVDVLDNKRVATRLRILVEIAERQPAVSQSEIADEVGVTSQAVSEYIRELVDEGFVEKEARSRYRVTNEGVDWLFRTAEGVRRFADHVTEDLLGAMNEAAAIATDDVTEGETVSLTMREGYIHATPTDDGDATAVATTDAAAGGDVGVAEWEGVIDLEPGTVTVIQIPPVRAGGADAADLSSREAAIEAADLVVASGVEAVVALESNGVEPAVSVGAGSVASAGAERGLDVIVAATTDVVGRVTDELRDGDVPYEVKEA